MKRKLLLFLLLAALVPQAALAQATSTVKYDFEDISPESFQNHYPSLHPLPDGWASVGVAEFANWPGIWSLDNVHGERQLSKVACQNLEYKNYWYHESQLALFQNPALREAIENNCMMMSIDNGIVIDDYYKNVANIVVLPKQDAPVTTIKFLAWKHILWQGDFSVSFSVGYVDDAQFNSTTQWTFHHLQTITLKTTESATPSNSTFTINNANVPPTARIIFKLQREDQNQQQLNDAYVNIDNIELSVLKTHIASTASETAMTWSDFATSVNSGTTYSGMTLSFDDDISTTTMVGATSNDNPNKFFCGTFDGQGHTISIQLTNAPQYSGAFRCIDGATIKNLKTVGSISTNKKLNGGIVAYSKGKSSIENCISSVSITSSLGGDNSTGGIIGHVHANTGMVQVVGCVFNGSLTGPNSNATYNGGIIGYCSGDKGVSVSNCIFDPNNVSHFSGNTIGRNVTTITNCYYTQSLGTAQGKKLYTVTAESPVTVEMNGTPTNYNMSHITAFNGTPGLLYNGTLIAGSGDNLSLNLGGSVGNGYLADHGTLTGTANPYTLTMAAYNTVISTMKTHIASAASETAMTWSDFATSVNNGTTYEGMTIYLDEDIATSTMVGTVVNNTTIKPFMGTFDGQGHTITFNLGTASSRTNVEQCAPFRFARGATIKNLRVTGAIYTSTQFASGFVARVQYDGITFINCESNILINSSKSGEARHSAFLANFNVGVARFEGCAFTGQFVGTSSTNWGGFVGHFSVGQGTVELSNCVFAPTQVNVNTSGGFTFARPSSGSSGVTTTNCYYTQTLGTAQGKKLYTITAESPVSVEMNGTATDYDVSGITAYSGTPGLLYNGTIIAGSGDQMSLNLGSSVGNGYLADHGTLTGTANPYMLAMAAFNTIISLPPIDFVDDRVKAICVAQWDSNQDGDLSYGEAAAVMSIGQYFRNNEQITSFDELQYFTGLGSIGDYAFTGCESLSSIEIPISVTTIGDYAFAGCYNLTSFEIPSSVTTIGEAVFYSCASLTSLSVAYGNTKYDSRDNCNAIIETITNTLVSGCQNTVIPNTVTSIGVDAFAHSYNLSSIVIPESVTSIGETAFQGCSGLTSVEIGNAVTSIGQWAFFACQALGSVEIPASVTSIGKGAFEKCGRLSSLTVLATVPPTLGEDVFKDVNSSFFVYVPCLDLEAYQLSPWSVFTLKRTGCDAVVNVLPVTSYGSDPTAQGGWYLIASPLVSSVEPAVVGNMLSNVYDLYAFDGSQETKEWRNFKNSANNGFTRLSFGQGYLYANSNNVDLEFVGEPFLANSYTVTLQTDDTKLGDWNLVGNSFSTEANVSLSDYYRIEEGSRDKIVLSSGPVNAMEGIFVSYAAADAITITEEGTPLEITFTKATRGERAVASPMVNIDLRNAEGRLLDRARLRTGEGASMSKLELLSDPNRLYFRKDGKDYAVARVNSQGELPLHFEAAQNGTFTLNVNVEGMNLSYLHLIDNMTGADVDLLASNGQDAKHSTYTFKAKTTDYASRFRLVFATVGEDTVGDDETFAFNHNGNWIIANEGRATLQVIDMQGRILSNEQIEGNAETRINAAAGVYVIRLVNGENVRTQKVVVE